MRPAHREGVRLRDGRRTRSVPPERISAPRKTGDGNARRAEREPQAREAHKSCSRESCQLPGDGDGIVRAAALNLAMPKGAVQNLFAAGRKAASRERNARLTELLMPRKVQ